jgi:hypothetical protein
MIKASELRIGNFISDDDGVLAKVIGFTPFEHSVRCDEEEGCQLLVDCYQANGSMRSGCSVDSPECNPIPLTPQWLERIGFKKDVDQPLNPVATYYKLHIELRTSGYITITALAVHQDTEKMKAGHAYASLLVNDFWASNNLEHVHQLQNLYYALTGEELEIK